MKSPKEKFEKLVSPKEIKKIVKNCKLIPPSSNVKIKVIKQYLDQRSYSLVAIYSFNGFKTVGVANSDGKKEYPWQVTKNIYHCFEKNNNVFIPKAYCYQKEFGIFFREYQKGKILSSFLKNPKKKELKLVQELLDFLPRVDPKKSQEIKKGISFDDFEKNIKILDKRKEKNVIKAPYLSLKKKIKKHYLKNKKGFFVHGDFNPFNIFIQKSSISLIDMEKAHFGAKEEDPASLIAHLKYSLDFNLKKNEIKAWQDTIDSQNYDKKIFKMFEQYFGLLIASHIMVWNNYQKGLKVFKKIYKK